MSMGSMLRDAWEREPTTGRHFTLREGQEPELPTDGVDRGVFCYCYADEFRGDNHEEALRFARFCVLYLKGMRLPPYDST
jgi:hypothetical protein